MAGAGGTGPRAVSCCWPLVRLIVIGNVGWGLAAMGLRVGGFVQPGPAGLDWLAPHAVCVLGFSTL
jgi:hypothetical protein